MQTRASKREARQSEKRYKPQKEGEFSIQQLLRNAKGDCERNPKVPRNKRTIKDTLSSNRQLRSAKASDE